MSNLADQPIQDCNTANAGSIALTVRPKTKNIGDFNVRRLLPNPKRQMVGPWIFFDHMGPTEFDAGSGINVRPHPHINLATVTYLFEGELLHRDALGSVQTIEPGAINLMVTGSGLVHSERERPEVTAVPHKLHGLQMWMALPEGVEEIDPAFYHYPAASIPKVFVDDVPVRLLIGAVYGIESPVQTFSETVYFEAMLEADQQLELPLSPELAVYVVSGSVKIEQETLEPFCMALLKPHTVTTLTAEVQTRIAVIGGAKLGKRFIEWNFVSSNKQRIEQAKKDWRAGRFQAIPSDNKEFIPLPD